MYIMFTNLYVYTCSCKYSFFSFIIEHVVNKHFKDEDVYTLFNIM